MTAVLSRRDVALLLATAAGRTTVVAGRCCPDMQVDGCWCDQTSAWQLVADGLVSPAVSAPAGIRVLGTLTAAGRLALRAACAPTGHDYAATTASCGCGGHPVRLCIRCDTSEPCADRVNQSATRG